MSAWRRKALELFPELRDEINPVPRRHHGYDSYYELFFDLHFKFQDALSRSDRDSLRKIFALARWALRQRRNPDLTNAVCVGFYEHVFDGDRRDWDAVIPWLGPDILQTCWYLWEERLAKEDIQHLRERLATRLDRPARRSSQNPSWHGGGR